MHVLKHAHITRTWEAHADWIVVGSVLAECGAYNHDDALVTDGVVSRHRHNVRVHLVDVYLWK